MTEEYRDRFRSYMFSADVAFAISLARDVGIFETLMKSTKPLTSGQIAKDKQLRERFFSICYSLVVEVVSFFKSVGFADSFASS